MRFSESTRWDGVTPDVRKLRNILVPIAEEFRIMSFYLFGRCGSVEVLGVVAVMPKEEDGTQIPVGTLYRRLREVLGRRMRLYCVRNRVENHEGGHEHE